MGVINLVYIIWIITKIIIVLLPVLFVSLSEMQKVKIYKILEHRIIFTSSKIFLDS